MKTPKKTSTSLQKPLLIIFSILILVVIFAAGMKYQKYQITHEKRNSANYFENQKWGYSIDVSPGFKMKDPNPDYGHSFIQKIGADKQQGIFIWPIQFGVDMAVLTPIPGAEHLQITSPFKKGDPLLAKINIEYPYKTKKIVDLSRDGKTIYLLRFDNITEGGGGHDFEKEGTNYKHILFIEDGNQQGVRMEIWGVTGDVYYELNYEDWINRIEILKI
ncbi:MAG: hypothetical protein Q7S61_02540 [bacterium]|nr:hypothetical protein [bacterium]